MDVFIYSPGSGRNYYTLVTSGMSDLPMTLPPEVGTEFARAELIWYVDEPAETYLRLLQFLAHFPHDNATWLHWDHTIPNRSPPTPFFEGTPLDTLFLMPTLVAKDMQFQDRLVLSGDPVRFLWVVPITSAECGLKLEQGSDALYDLFEEAGHPHVFTGGREGYV